MSHGPEKVKVSVHRYTIFLSNIHTATSHYLGGGQGKTGIFFLQPLNYQIIWIFKVSKQVLDREGRHIRI